MRGLRNFLLYRQQYGNRGTMNILNMTKREKMLFYITVSVVAIWAGQKYVVQPILDSKAVFGNKYASSIAKLEKYQKLVDGENIIKDKFSKIASNVGVSGSIDEEIAKFLTEIESIAGLSGVAIYEIKPASEDETDIYIKLQSDMEIEGDISEILDFMRKIKNSASLMAAEKLTLSAKQSGSSLIKCRILVSKVIIN